VDLMNQELQYLGPTADGNQAPVETPEDGTARGVVMENRIAYVEYYRLMLRIRCSEERIGWLFSRNLTMGTAHLSIGQEASAVGVLSAALPGDYVVSTHRGHGHLIAKGGSPARLLAEICGRATGYCRGKGGSQHIAVRELAFLGTNGITGGGLPVATGAALSSKLRKTGEVVLCFFGDGAANQGTFHEALNMASVWKLPIVYVCENNGYAMWTSALETTSVRDVVDRAAGYGMPGLCVDGMDLLAVQAAASRAIAHARSGAGPVLLETKTYRFCGHSKSENGKGYRPADEILEWERHDPLPAWRAHLRELGVTDAELVRVEAEVTAEVDAATQFALDSPYASDEALLDVYANVHDTPSFADIRLVQNTPHLQTGVSQVGWPDGLPAAAWLEQEVVPSDRASGLEVVTVPRVPPVGVRPDEAPLPLSGPGVGRDGLAVEVGAGE
jgi:acetoin:2,6-dichlorophenolindophenol oxidoreductase subunit alpha